ncbi:MAG: hypothetical protein ACK521_00745 [bacterium]
MFQAGAHSMLVSPQAMFNNSANSMYSGNPATLNLQPLYNGPQQYF